MLYISFGLAGAGKTYFGKWFAREFNVHFEDADDWLTADMRQCIQSGTSFTRAMCDQYFDIVIRKIATLQNQYPHIIISQAFYLEKNRQQFLAAYPHAIFILMHTDTMKLDERLMLRTKGVSFEYAKSIEQYFELPQHPYITINNTAQFDDESLRAQCASHPEIVHLKKQASISHDVIDKVVFFSDILQRSKSTDAIQKMDLVSNENIFKL
jgi:gluconate kinase